MVLINGAEGIGTGWSTYIPNYNPREVAANLRRLLRGEQPEVMQPWYRGFKGTIQEVPSKTAGKSYNVYGTIAQVRRNGRCATREISSACKRMIRLTAGSIPVPQTEFQSLRKGMDWPGVEGDDGRIPADLGEPYTRCRCPAGSKHLSTPAGTVPCALWQGGQLC